MKTLIILNKSTGINFDNIILDILDGEYHKYDYKSLNGYNNLYRGYRIIFSTIDGNINVLLIGTRGDVYKKLKQMFI